MRKGISAAWRGEGDRLAGDIRGCEKDQEQGEKKQKDLSGEIYRLKRAYSEQCLQHLELEKADA